MKKWLKFFSSLSEDQLQALALLRVIECTNGCIQHAYRDKRPNALGVEETRKAMKYSMAAMKELAFKVGDTGYTFSGETAQGLREARKLYIRAFKDNEETAMEEFMDCSIACVQTLGEARIREAGVKVQENLEEHYPKHTVNWGVSYLINLPKES